MLNRSVPLIMCAFVLPALLCSCGGGNSGISSVVAGDHPVSATRTYNNLRFTLSTIHSAFLRSEHVPLTFTVTNTSSQPIPISGGGCDVVLKVLQGSQVVGPEPFGCAEGVFTGSFAPGVTTTYTLTWTGNGLDSKRVAPGTYTLRVWSTFGGINGTGLTAAEQEANLFASIPVTLL